MIHYVLCYARPRLSQDKDVIIYEKQHLRANWRDDQEAIEWATEVVPWEFGLTFDGRPYVAVPIHLSRSPRDQEKIVWQRSSKVYD